MASTWTLLVLMAVFSQPHAHTVVKRQSSNELICRSFPTLCPSSSVATRDTGTPTCGDQLQQQKESCDRQMGVEYMENLKKMAEVERLINLSLTSSNSEMMVDAFCRSSSFNAPAPATPACVVSQWTAWSGPIGFQTTITRTREILSEGCGCPAISELKETVDLKDYCTSGSSNPNNTAEEFNNQFLNKTKPTDTLFIVDSSASIDQDSFDLLIKALIELLHLICRGVGPNPDNNRVAFIFFATDVKIVYRFRDPQNLTDIEDVLRKVVHMKENTCTGTAINEAVQIFEDARPDVVHDTLLITDGQSNCGDPIPSAVDNLSQVSNVYCLGINLSGDAGAQNEIRSIVSGDDKHIFSVTRFADFFQMMSYIKANLQNPKNPCQPLEVVEKRRK